MKQNNALKSPVFVANSILILAKKRNIKITPLKLYSLIYFVYSEYLLKTNQKLFNECFEVTDEGPVLPSIWAKFNCYGDEYIKTLATNAQGVATYYKKKGIYGNILDETFNEYKDYLQLQTFELTVSENSAYEKAKLNNKGILSDDDIIDEIIIRKEKQLKKYIK